MPQPAKRLCLLLLALLAMPAAARAAEVGVAVASNFAAPRRVLAPAFERATGYRAVVALGSLYLVGEVIARHSGRRRDALQDRLNAPR